jgi:PIN domain nuclease of toxin-antitoxin system
MTAAVLDASALLALLRNEPGGDTVKSVLAESAIATANLSEVVAHYARQGASEPDIRRLLDPLPMTRAPLDEDLAFEAGLLIPSTRPAGLSLGDRACLALARRLGVPALTADRAWVGVANAVGVQVQLIR